MPRTNVLDTLYLLAEEQDGYFTARQASKRGIDPTALTKAVLRGRLERLSRGVYRMVQFPAHERAQLWEAVFWPQLRSDVTGVLSHHSALLLNELSDVNPAQVHITLPKPFILRREPPKWLAVHRAELDPNDVELINGLPATTLRRTLSDLQAIGANAIVADAIADARAKGRTIPVDFR